MADSYTPVIPEGSLSTSFRYVVEGGIEPGCRARPSLSLAIENSPAFAAVALWVRHENGDKDETPDGVPTIAWTNSRKIVYNPGFAKIPLREQAGVTVHEIMHVVLMHPQRAMKMARVTPGFLPRLFNIAADCLINESILKQRWMALPEYGWTLTKVLADHTAWCKQIGKPAPKHPPLDKWSVEDLYRFLARWREQAIEALVACLGESGEGETLDLATPPGGNGQDRQDEEAGESGGKTRELDRQAQQRREEREAEEELARTWNHRLRRAMAGDRPGGLMRSLEGDFPTVTTPWEKILRSQVLKAFSPRSEINTARPSRRWVSTSACGYTTSFEPAVIHTQPVPRIAVMADTSGSMSGDILKRVAAEIEAIGKRTKAEIYVIVCDAEVHEVVKIAAGGLGNVLSKIEFKGGGGTDFRPAFEVAKKIKPSVAVYLTDLMGTFPTKPRFPTIWAVPKMPGSEGLTPPFGRHLILQ